MPTIQHRFRYGDQVEVEGRLGIWTVDEVGHNVELVDCLWHENFGRIYGIPIQQLKRVPSTRDLILKIENTLQQVVDKLDRIESKLGIDA